MDGSEIDPGKLHDAVLNIGPRIAAPISVQAPQPPSARRRSPSSETSDASRKRRLWLEWWAMAVVASALLITLVITESTTRIDNSLYDLSLKLKPVAVRKDVVVVAIDPPSLDKVGEWPWRRDVMAKLIDKIADGKPKALAVHFLFLFPTTKEADKAVGDAMRRMNTYLGIPQRPEDDGRAAAIVRPIPLIDSAAKGLGAGDASPDPDGLVRRVRLFEGPQDNPSSRMVLQMARLEGKGPDGSKPHKGNGKMLIPFAGPPGTFEQIPAISLLNGSYSPKLLHNKYVLLGATAKALLDNYPTPLSGAEGMPAVEVDANILNSLLNDIKIRQATAFETVATSLLLLWGLLIALVRLGPRENLLVAMALSGLPLAASVVGVIAGFWLPPVAYLVTVAIVVPYWGWRRLNAASGYFASELLALERQAEEIFDTPSLATAAVGGDTVLQQIMLLEDTRRQISNLRQFVADILANFPDPVFVVDRSGRVLDSNQAARAFADRIDASWTRRAPIARVLSGIKPLEGETRPLWPPPSAADAEDPAARPITGFGPSGKAYELRCTETHSADDEPTGWIVHLADVTAMVSATRQREEALQLLSHDMRSPLAAILATLELPENRSTPVSLRRRIADQAMRTLNLADDFIRLAKAQSDNYRFEDIDLAHVAQDAVDAVWPLAQAGGLRVKAPSTDIEFVVMADRGLLTRALVNLLDNAVKFSPAGSEVACLLDLDELNGRPAVKVRITDQAGGMSQAQVDNLFKKFASARKAVSGASGVGLGLLLVDAVVTRHDGVISCESTEGQGTTFAITLPLLEEPAGND